MGFNVPVMNESMMKLSTSRCKPFLLILWITRAISTYKLAFFVDGFSTMLGTSYDRLCNVLFFNGGLLTNPHCG